MDASVLGDRFQLMFRDQLAKIRGVGVESQRGQDVLAAGVRTFETLLHELMAEVDDDRSQLREEIERANLDVEYLRQQLGITSELLRLAQKTGKRRWLRAAAGALLALLGAFATGATEGVGTVGVQAASQSRASQWVSELEHLDHELEADRADQKAEEDEEYLVMADDARVDIRTTPTEHEIENLLVFLGDLRDGRFVPREGNSQVRVPGSNVVVHMTVRPDFKTVNVSKIEFVSD